MPVFDLDPILRQNEEFDALTALAERWRVLRNIPVVDDDYPEHRSRYEGAMFNFLRACKANGREV